jgi:hypothetical protein
VARIVDLGVTKYTWVEGDDGIADVSAPTTTELNGGKDISENVVTTTSAGPTSSDTVNERSITDVANVVVPTIGNYEGNLVLFRDYTDGAPTQDDLLPTFADGAVGFLVKRMGKPHTEDFASGDVVEVYKFRADHPQPQGGSGEGYLKLVVPLLQQGLFDVAATVGGAGG